MKSIIKWLEIVEKEVGTSVVQEKDKIIAIESPECIGVARSEEDEKIIERLLQERMAEMREKYGPIISESDFLVIRLRKFYSQKEGGQSCEV
jgi:hypothetical protein